MDVGPARSVPAADVHPPDDAGRAPAMAPGRPSSHERTIMTLGQSHGALGAADLPRSDQLGPSGSRPDEPD